MSSCAHTTHARHRGIVSKPSVFWSFLILLSGGCAISWTTQAAALGRGECRSMPSKILGHPVQYCVILPPSYDSSEQNYPVLYFLHGLGSNSEILINSGGMDLINDLWSQKQIGEFLIVTPDAGEVSISTRGTEKCATKIFLFTNSFLI